MHAYRDDFHYPTWIFSRNLFWLLCWQFPLSRRQNCAHNKGKLHAVNFSSTCCYTCVRYSKYQCKESLPFSYYTELPANNTFLFRLIALSSETIDYRLRKTIYKSNWLQQEELYHVFHHISIKSVSARRCPYQTPHTAQRLVHCWKSSVCKDNFDKECNLTSAKIATVSFSGLSPRRKEILNALSPDLFQVSQVIHFYQSQLSAKCRREFVSQFKSNKTRRVVFISIPSLHSITFTSILDH